MKTVNIFEAAIAVVLACGCGSVLAQSSVGSLAEYKKKQDDGLAQTIRESQARAKAGRLAMLDSGDKPGKGQMRANRPAVIRLENRPRATGVDNRHSINVR